MEAPTPTPRSATSELGSNSPDFRILLVEWNPLSSESPGAATCCAGGGPGFCVDFFRPASLWAETACVEPRVRRERDWGFAGHRSAAFWPKQQILRPDAFRRTFWEIDLQVHHCWDGRKLFCPDQDATTVCCHPPIVTRCGAGIPSVLAAERRFRGRLYGSPSQPSCGDSGPATARSHQIGPIPPIRSSFVKSRRKVSDHLHWCGPISHVR